MVKVRFKQDRVVQDGLAGTAHETRFAADEVVDLAEASANHWLSRGIAERVLEAEEPAPPLGAAGITKDDLFSADAVRGVTEKLVEFQRDGAAVQLNGGNPAGEAGESDPSTADGGVEPAGDPGSAGEAGEAGATEPGGEGETGEGEGSSSGSGDAPAGGDTPGGVEAAGEGDASSSAAERGGGKPKRAAAKPTKA